jgi:NAD(P)H-hydrate repair Nnr-like enzyme with NAD(P)H-hydrate dehydratase domain
MARSSSDQEKERVAEKAFAEMKVWLPVFDCMVIGPGLGRDELLLRTVSKVIQEARKAELPLVLDGVSAGDLPLLSVSC